MLMQKISNRKLYRLVLCMIFSMGFFLAYLVVSDIYRAQIDGDSKYRHSYTRINVEHKGRNHAHDQIHEGLKHPLTGRTQQKATDSRSTPVYSHSKSTPRTYPAQHSTTDESITSKTSKTSSLHTQHGSVSAKTASSTSKEIVSSPRGKHKLPSEISAPSTVIKADQGMADLAHPKDNGKRYLIYLCHSLTWCGGWGDRQRGITSVFYLSKAVGREFKIIMTTPCNLAKFYRPFKTKWMWDSNAVRNTSFIISDVFPKSNFKSLITTDDFNVLFPQKVVYIKTNHDYSSMLLKNPHYTEFAKKYKKVLVKRAGRFRWAWNNLMQPSHYLFQRLQNVVGTDILVRKGLLHPDEARTSPMPVRERASFKNRGTSTLICAHVRMGRNPTIPMDEDFDSISPSDIPKLLAFVQSKDSTGDSRFFVATDFEGIRTEFRKSFGDRLLDYGGKILHIDRQRNQENACVGFEVALLDQLILSVCDILVISRSGFSIHASYVSNITTPVYILEDGKISLFKI